MFEFQRAVNVDCRMALVSACEPDTVGQDALHIQAIETFTIRKRDVLDFTVDFNPWLSANGGPKLTHGEWFIAADSPSVPTIVSQLFAPGGKVTAIISVPAPLKPNDAFWFDVIAVTGITAPADLTSDIVLPPRTLTRRVHIIVVAG